MTMETTKTIALKELRLHLMTLLSTMKATGYDLTKIMESSHVWKASHQQTYRDLNQLRDVGYLTYEIEPQDGKPDRKVYSITSKGRAALETALLEMSPKVTPQCSMHTIMLNAGHQEYFEQLAEKLELAIDAATAEMNRVGCPIEELAMKREIFLYHGELEFCAEAINHLEQVKIQKAA